MAEDHEQDQPELLRPDALDVEERRVFVRTDLAAFWNGDELVPQYAEPFLLTLTSLLTRGASLVIASSNIGSSKSFSYDSDELMRLGGALAERLSAPVQIPDETSGDGVRKLARDLRPGQVLLLTHLDEVDGELDNTELCATVLGGLADTYVGDSLIAFANGRASALRLPGVFETRAIGPALTQQLERLVAAQSTLANTHRAFIWGGGVSELEINTLRHIVDHATDGDVVILTGEVAEDYHRALGSTFFATEKTAGSSRAKPSILGARFCRELSLRLEARGAQLEFPTDFKVGRPSSDINSGTYTRTLEDSPDENETIIGIGSASARRYVSRLKTCKQAFVYGDWGRCGFNDDEIKTTMVAALRKIADGLKLTDSCREQWGSLDIGVPTVFGSKLALRYLFEDIRPDLSPLLTHPEPSRDEEPDDETKPTERRKR